MATQILRDATIWLDGVAVHEIGNSVSFEQGLEPQDCTVFGNSARKYAGGLFTASLSADGYADFGNGYDGALDTVFRNRTSTVASVSPDSTDFSVGYFFEALQSEMTPLSGSVGDMAAISVMATTRGTYGPIRGNILVPSASRAGSSSGTARQLGAVSATQRVFAAAHVTAAAGGTLDITVKSDDNSGMTTPTTQITIPQFAAVTGSAFGSTAGAITDDWWRVTWTIASGTYTFVVFVGIATV